VLSAVRLLGVALLAGLAVACGEPSSTPQAEPPALIARFAVPSRIEVQVEPYASVDAALAADPDAAPASPEHESALILAQAASELRRHLTDVGLPVAIGSNTADAGPPAIVIVLRGQRVLPGVDYPMLGDQGYAVVPHEGRVFVVANKAEGALYGTYRLLGLLGFAWHDPFETLIPGLASLLQPRDWLSLQEVPRTRLRGFWVYDTDPIPDAFALWLARNRFNLSAPARPALQRRLGLKAWAGHHELLQQEFSRAGLFAQHPEWFSVVRGSRRPVSPTGNYINPAFGHPGAAEYFASRMLQRLEHGDLRSVDVLNIWPADDRFRPFDESDQARSIGNPTDNLLTFYGRVAAYLRHAHSDGRLSRPVTIAGISYFQTMEAPTSQAAVRAVAHEDYVHVFYPIDRSWGGPVADRAAGRDANDRIMEAMARWQAVARLPYGVVDYHNVSTFAGVAVTDHPHLQANLGTFTEGRTALFASMHPLLRNPGPRRLTNVLLAELLWLPVRGGSVGSPPDAEPVVRQFFERRYGPAASEWRAVHDTMAKSVDNAAELFGINSLYWMLHQDLIWTPPFYRDAEAVAFLPRFMAGGAQDVPAAYSGIPSFRARFRGLHESVSMQQQASTAGDQVLAQLLSPAIRSRMESDVVWFQSTASRYRLMSASIDLAVRGARGEDTFAARVIMAREIDLLAGSATTLDTVSPVDQRAFLDLHRIKSGLPVAPARTAEVP